MRISLISKAFKSFLNDGLFDTFTKISNYQNFKKNVLLAKTVEDRFTWIYTSNYWGSNESASGAGSTLRYTENLRKLLPQLIDKYSIKTIFDAPCGDFHWMNHLLPLTNVTYVGGDIVKPLIKDLNNKYGEKNISFVHINLVDDAFPSADLMICRDCLFHLSYLDTRKLLKNFLDSNISYLLTTTHVNKEHLFSNEDILTGDFRLIDLFSAPYNFPHEALERIDDWIYPDPERQMCLWSREQIKLAMSK